MPNLEFEVYCGTCGAGLCNQTDVVGAGIHVKVCEKCLEEIRQEGYDDGFNEGYDKAAKEIESNATIQNR